MYIYICVIYIHPYMYTHMYTFIYLYTDAHAHITLWHVYMYVPLISLTIKQTACKTFDSWTLGVGEEFNFAE